MIQSPLKWVGSKRKIMYQILIDTSKKVYCEPFVGGCHSLVYVLQNYNFDKIIASDANDVLINFYKDAINNFNELVAECTKLQETEQCKENYYIFRDEFNSLDHCTRKSALFFYLNKTCFNGLYRVNKTGIFNTSYGNRKFKFDYDELKNFSNLISSVEFKHDDYYNILKECTSNTFVYLDPPYLGTYKRYTSTYDASISFEDVLLENLKQLDNKNVTFTLSNSNEDYFYENYSMFSIHAIDSKVSFRSKINLGKECIITNW